MQYGQTCFCVMCNVHGRGVSLPQKAYFKDNEYCPARWIRLKLGSFDIGIY
jgi:hypothetical protein